MDLRALQLMPTFVLVFFRVAGLMLAAPLFGSASIPRQVKVLLALVLAMGLSPHIAAPSPMPTSMWQLAVGIGGELIFGMAMGLCLSFAFVAVNWAGQLIGQQMGLNIAETFDPQFGRGGSIPGNLYFMLTLAIFLVIRGHHLMLTGIRASFDALPLLSVGMNRSVLDLFLGLLLSATILAVQLAAPVFVTMLVVDVALGFIGKTMPQFNVMATGLSMKSGLGIVVLLLGLAMASSMIRGELEHSLHVVLDAWQGLT